MGARKPTDGRFATGQLVAALTEMGASDLLELAQEAHECMVLMEVTLKAIKRDAAVGVDEEEDARRLRVANAARQRDFQNRLKKERKAPTALRPMLPMGTGNRRAKEAA